MIGFLLLLFPFVLLGFVMLMGTGGSAAEQDRRDHDQQIEKFLDEANRDELNTFVSEGADTALRRFRKRLRPNRRRRGWRRAAG